MRCTTYWQHTTVYRPRPKASPPEDVSGFIGVFIAFACTGFGASVGGFGGAIVGLMLGSFLAYPFFK